MAAKLGALEGNLLQAELLEARTGIQVKDMQGARAWRSEESGKFGLEILHPHKTGRFSRTKTQWHRLSMNPRPDGKPVTFADAQRMAKHLDGFLRDNDYQEPKAKKTSKPQKAAQPKTKPVEKAPEPSSEAANKPTREWFKKPSWLKWPKFGTRNEGPLRTEENEPKLNTETLNKNTINPILTDEKALTEALAAKLGTAPEYIEGISLSHDPENPSNGHTLNVTIKPLEGLTENSTINDVSVTELLGRTPENLDINEFARTVFKADQHVKELNATETAPNTDKKADHLPTAAQALATISDFPKEMAETMGVEIPEENTNAWKDLTGAGHLYIRGAAAPLLRMADNNHNMHAAASAMGTVGFANKKPQVFPGEHVGEVAAIAAKLLDAEKAGAKLSDTLSANELDLISREINNFSKQLETLASGEDAPEYLKKYTQNVTIVNADFQNRVQNDIKSTLSADADGQANDPTAEKAAPKPAPTAPEGDAAKAVAILSDFPKEMAETMGVEIPVDAKDSWRDITGSGHVYIRGAWASLERIANNAHDADAANAATGTIAYAQKAPEKFLGENAADVAKIAAKILQVEKDGGSLADAITAQDIDVLKTELSRFKDIVAAHGDDAPAFLKKYAEQTAIVNNHYQTMAPKLAAALTGDAKAAETPTKDKGGDLPSFLKPGAKTMDERIAEHQAKKAAEKPARETTLMKAANAALLKQKNIDIDDVLDADPNKVFEKIDALDLKAEGTKFGSVEEIKQALKDLKAHRVAVRAKHAFSTDNVVAMAARDKENALTDKKLSTLNSRIDSLDPEVIENIDVPLPKNGKDRVIKVTYKDPETTGPKRITIPYSRGAKASIDSALSKLRTKFGEVDGHEHVCHAAQDFVRNNAREHGAVQDEYKIDINKTDDLGLIHFGDVLYSQIGQIAGMNKEDVLGVNVNKDGSLEFVNFNGQTKTVNANVDKSIFRSAEDMAEALNRSLEHERFMKAAAVQHAPSAEAA